LVEIVKRYIPLNRKCFTAFGVSAKKLARWFPVKTASRRLFKGICELNFICRCKFKNPVTIKKIKGKFSFSHKYTLTYCYAASELRKNIMKAG